MTMVSMKQDKKAANDTMLAPCAAGEAPLYPYGLTICLNDESLRKLGMDAPPSVGQVFTLTARVEVKSTRAEKEQGGTDISADLQITDMELGADSSEATPAQRLYSTSKMPA